jgi:DNA-binding response OmpR family regulator
MSPTESKIRLLVVEDEKKLAQSLAQQLSAAGYEAALAFDGLSASEQLQAQSFDLIVLDLKLPKKSGLEVLQELRSRANTTPVLILSARDKVEERVQGLQLGADDYLVKPFDSGELLARIDAILRRAGLARAALLQAGDLTLDPAQRTVKRADKEITLTQKEFALLEYFMRNKNQILTRKRIAEQVWGYTFDTGTNIVDVYVSYLRKKIEEGFSSKLIQTIYGEGFLLKAE